MIFWKYTIVHCWCLQYTFYANSYHGFCLVALEEKWRNGTDRVSVGSSATYGLANKWRRRRCRRWMRLRRSLHRSVHRCCWPRSILFGTSTGAAVAGKVRRLSTTEVDPNTKMSSRILTWYELLNSIVQFPATIDSMGEIAVGS
mmetsp:Transcript_41852/g.100467  ORF Transcript_41852/g.100467 Transcript_41852/m.100467 type:complete len:144 (+) Transcript_41852:597-1028(+)